MNAERKHDGQVNLRAVLGLGTLPATADAIMLHAANQINAMRQIRDQRERDVAEMRDVLEDIEPTLLKCMGYDRYLNIRIGRMLGQVRAIIEKTKGE